MTVLPFLGHMSHESYLFFKKIFPIYLLPVLSQIQFLGIFDTNKHKQVNNFRVPRDSWVKYKNNLVDVVLDVAWSRFLKLPFKYCEKSCRHSLGMLSRGLKSANRVIDENVDINLTPF